MKIYTGTDDIEEIQSVKDFFKIMIPEQSLIKHGFIYRGQENWDWKLVPSMFRLKNFSGGTWTWGGVEMFILQEFFREAEPYLQSFVETPFRKMMLAQHYGAPTRLLDWTSNPLVALYFATKELNDNETDGAFYIARTNTSLTGGVDYTTEQDLDKYDFCSLIPSKFDDRILAQSAIFTTHTLPKELEPFIAPEDKEDPKQRKIYKFRVPQRFKIKIKLELEMLGITHARLFPGLDGIGHNIKWLFQRHSHWKTIIKNWNDNAIDGKNNP